ncbi:MAG: HlyC/CorC family transporter [Alphaproteobacteria bacterium]
MAYIIIAIFVLLVLSAFFSASETAMTAASRARMHRLAQQGSKAARAVNELLARKERMIGAVLLGNNLVNILASALATSVLIGAFGEPGVAYATVVMTLLVLIFAEVMPKSYAINHADRLALMVAPVLLVIVNVLGPAVITIQAVVRATLSAFGVTISRTMTSSEIEEELRGVIELHGAHAAADDKQAMLRGIMDLAELDVSDVMTHRSDVVTIDADLDPDRIIDLVLGSPYSRLPLWRDEPDNIIGVIHAKDLLRLVRQAEGTVGREQIEAVAGKPWFIPESTSLFHQLQMFRRRREHFALVVDEYGSLMGVVTLEDIIEEIVGEIDDEHDPHVTGVRAQPDGSFIVAGTTTVRDLNREFGWSLPDEEASTIAGLLMHVARRIPKPGQRFDVEGFAVEVLRRQHNRITLLRLVPPPAAAPAGK